MPRCLDATSQVQPALAQCAAQREFGCDTGDYRDKVTLVRQRGAKTVGSTYHSCPLVSASHKSLVRLVVSMLSSKKNQPIGRQE